jgi:cytoskeleton protein RodZ
MGSSGTQLRVEFGATVRAAREARGLDARAAAAACRLSPEQLQGLEKGEAGSFYSDAFLVRAARAYGAFLGVPLPAEYTQDPALSLPAGSAVTHGIATPTRLSLPSRPSLRIPLALGAVAVSLVYAVWFFSSGSERMRAAAPQIPEAEPARQVSAPRSAVSADAAEEVAARSNNTPAAVPAAVGGSDAVRSTAPPVVSTLDVAAPRSPVRREHDDATAASRIFLQVFRDVGLTMKDGTGVTLVHGRLSPNEGRRLTGAPPFRLVTTDADAIAVFYRGQRVRLLPDGHGEWQAEFGMP